MKIFPVSPSLCPDSDGDPEDEAHLNIPLHLKRLDDRLLDESRVSWLPQESSVMNFLLGSIFQNNSIQGL